MKCEILKVSRGQVFYYSQLWGVFGKNKVPENFNVRGSLERKVRPHLVISVNDGNASATTCNLLPITRRNRVVIPSQVQFFYNGSCQVILTEQPVTANIADLGNYIFTVGSDVLDKLDSGLAIQFGIKHSTLEERLDRLHATEQELLVVLKRTLVVILVLIGVVCYLSPGQHLG